MTVQVLVLMCVHVEAGEGLWVSSSVDLCWAGLRKGLIESEARGLSAKLAGRQLSSRDLHISAPQYWVCSHVHPYPYFFIWVLGGEMHILSQQEPLRNLPSLRFLFKNKLYAYINVCWMCGVTCGGGQNKVQHGFWESNLGPLEEQPSLTY